MVTPPDFVGRGLAIFAVLVFASSCPDPSGAAKAQQSPPALGSHGQPAQPSPLVRPEAKSSQRKAQSARMRHPAVPRVVAIGDLHGDLQATRAVLHLVGAVDHADQWTGGGLVVVQTGDVLDRGDDEQAILDWLTRLDTQARAKGGAVHVLNGNHEIMNVVGDFRYVTPQGFVDFSDVVGLEDDAADLASVPAPMRARAAAFRPGGPYARRLAQHDTVIIVGDTLFVHGGILPAHVQFGLERINQGVRDLMAGNGPPAMDFIRFVMSPDSPVWTRRVSDDPSPEACAEAEKTLDGLGLERMVVGHTVRLQGISPLCDGHVWPIDVGLARHYGGTPAALEITPAGVRVLTAEPAVAKPTAELTAK